jgi:phosphoglycolate phosphatase
MNPIVSISANDWSLDRVSAILFDKDGTFIDSHHYWGRIIFHRSQAICDAFHLDPSYIEKIELVMGFSRKLGRLLPAGPIALVSRDEVISCLVRFLDFQGIQASDKQIAQIFEQVHHNMEKIDDHIKLIPSALPLFDALQKKNIKLAVVTTDAVKNTELTLEKLGLKSYFLEIVGRESCAESKSSGKPAIIALARMGARPEDSICIGDAPMDMQMTRKSKCKASIGVTTGQLSADQLGEFTPYVVNSLSG